MWKSKPRAIYCDGKTIQFDMGYYSAGTDEDCCGGSRVDDELMKRNGVEFIWLGRPQFVCVQDYEHINKWYHEIWGEYAVIS